MTNTERETINRQIFLWLNPDGCWHGTDYTNAPQGYPCKGCGERVASMRPNPDYHSWDGMRLLLEGLEAKGYVDIDLGRESAGWWARIDVAPNDDDGPYAEAESLPLALVGATLKLIEGEIKCTA